MQSALPLFIIPGAVQLAPPFPLLRPEPDQRRRVINHPPFEEQNRPYAIRFTVCATGG